MSAKRLIVGSLSAFAVAAYVIPAVRDEVYVWFAPENHPEYYRGLAFSFTGYIYPILLLLLFIAAAAPHVVGPRLPGFSGAIGVVWSRFTLVLLGVIGIVFMIWLAITPLF